MREAGLVGNPCAGQGRTTVRLAGGRAEPDLAEPDFPSQAPNRLCCADITYLCTWEDWPYLASRSTASPA